MKKNNITMKRFTYTILVTVLSVLISGNATAQTIQIGDLLTFPDGSQGIVVSVDNNMSGWAVDINDLDTTYQLLSDGNIPTSIQNSGAFASFSVNTWEPEGMTNTEALNAAGSPAAQAVDVEHGWYIPDAEQMQLIYGMAEILKPAFDAAGSGNISNITKYGRNYWTSSRSNNYFYYLANTSTTQGGNLATATPTTKYYVRRVRDFDQTYVMKKYWESITDASVLEISSDTSTIKVAPEATTGYRAVIVFNTDTFRVTGTVEVEKCCKLALNVDSVADEICGGDGSIFISSTLGTAPVRYSIDGGTTWQTDTVFSGLAAGSHQIIALDAEDCTDTVNATIAPHPVPVITVTCPPDISDTLVFGDCVMNIYPERIGTPTYVHSLEWPMDTSNNIPAGYLFQEGENIITWVFTDKCGNSDSCEQKVTIVFPQCPDAVDCEGNMYKGVRIGCDCWTGRNLESTQYSAGGTCVGEIPCIYEYNSERHPDVTTNVETFGRLYCFEAAIGDSSNNGYGHIQGICPEGWYLPTPEKYAALYALGADALKSPNYWIDGGGSNSTDFTWLPAGRWNGENGRFEGLLSEGYFWATQDTGSNVKAKAIYLRYDCGETMITETSTGNGYSVRCIKEGGNYKPHVVPIHRTAAVGDVLCSDGSTMSAEDFITSGKTAIGVVTQVDTNNKFGRAIALSGAKNNAAMHWCHSGFSTINSLTQTGTTEVALADMDGVGNTKSMVDKARAQQNETNLLNTSAYHCMYYDPATFTTGTDSLGWYMPSEGEMQLVYANRSVVNATLSELQALNSNISLLFNGAYWTSTEYNDTGFDYAWTITTSGEAVARDKWVDFYVRPMIQFTLP